MGQTNSESDYGRILSDKQREYLSSDPPHDNDSAERSRRGRIRGRYTNAFKDLSLLSNLPADDRKQLIEHNAESDPYFTAGEHYVARPSDGDAIRINPAQVDPDGPDEPESVFMPQVAYQLFKFLYSGFHDVGEPETFETMLKSAVKIAESDRTGIMVDDITVEFSVEHPGNVDVEVAKQKFDKGDMDALSGAEMKRLVQEGYATLE